MSCSPASRRRIWSAAVVAGTLFLLSGCKHLDRGRSVEPAISGPSLQSYDGERSPDTPVLHEPLPELSPVPPLPGAGHSVPPEPLPPPSPAPAEPSNTLVEPVVEPGPKSVSRSRSLWSQMSERASTVGSASDSPLPKLRQGRHAVVVSNSAPNRTMDSRFATTPFGVSVSTSRTSSSTSPTDEATARDVESLDKLAGNNHRPIESVASFAWRGGHSFSHPRPVSAEVATQGPVITPMEQPIAIKRSVIEDWPYRSPPSPVAADTRKNVVPQQVGIEQPTLSNEAEAGSAVQAPAALRDEATVPLLFPPGS